MSKYFNKNSFDGIYKGTGYKNVTKWHESRTHYYNEDAVYSFFTHSKREIDFCAY